MSKTLFCIKISALSSLGEGCHSKAVQQVENGLRLVASFLALSMSVAFLQKHSRYTGPDRSSARDGLAHFKGSLWCFRTSTGLGQLVEGARQACPGHFPCLVHVILTNNSVFSRMSSKVPWPHLIHSIVKPCHHPCFIEKVVAYEPNSDVCLSSHFYR